MKFRNMLLKYYNEAGADGADAGGQPPAGADGAGAGGQPPASADWRAALPDDLKASESLKSVKDIASLAKQFVDQQAYLGNAIRVPSEHASEADKKAFYDKLVKHAPDLIPRPNRDDPESLNAVLAALGRPDDKNLYEAPEIPAEAKAFVPEDRIEAFRDIAHKHGLTKDQFKGVLSEVLAADAVSIQAQQEALNQSRAALHREWGAAFEERTAQALKLAESTGAPAAFVEAIKGGAVNGEALKWLHSMASRMGGNLQIADDQGGSGKMTPGEAQSRIDEIMGNRKHPYWDAGHPDHRRAMDTMVELGRLADAGR